MPAFRRVFVAGLLAVSLYPAIGLTFQAEPVHTERDFLTRVRRLTVEGRRAGEGYWSPDGKRLVFQSEREPGNPFYQIYVLDLTTGDTKRISPGVGKTTCAFFRPGSDEIEFASTHADPKSKQFQDEELAFRASGQGAPLLVGLRPRDGHLRLQREDRRDEAADDRARLRRRGQLLARRPVDRVLVDARAPTTARSTTRRRRSLAGEPEQLRRDLHHARRRLGAEAADQRLRLRRRPVLHARRQEDRLAPLRRAGAHRRRLDDEPRRHRPEADHRLRIDELGALHAPVGRVLHLRVEQARVRELRAVHRRRGRARRSRSA